MWDAIKEIAMSPNITIILTFAVFAMIVFVVLSKSGLFNIHTAAVTIGATNRERQIMMQQIEWIKIHLEGLEAKMSKPERYSAWRGRYVVERVYDEYVEWIIFNHLSTSESYIEVKQDKVVNLVHTLTEKDEFHSEDFEKMLREDTRKCIEKLVQIRELYKSVV